MRQTIGLPPTFGDAVRQTLLLWAQLLVVLLTTAFAFGFLTAVGFKDQLSIAAAAAVAVVCLSVPYVRGFGPQMAVVRVQISFWCALASLLLVSVYAAWNSPTRDQLRSTEVPPQSRQVFASDGSEVLDMKSLLVVHDFRSEPGYIKANYQVLAPSNDPNRTTWLIALWPGAEERWYPSVEPAPASPTSTSTDIPVGSLHPVGADLYALALTPTGAQLFRSYIVARTSDNRWEIGLYPVPRRWLLGASLVTP